MKKSYQVTKLICTVTAAILLLGACASTRPTYIVSEPTPTLELLPSSTPFKERPVYEPGTLVDYIAQSGDTLDLLSVRFGSSAQEILLANPEIPANITTLPPGFPMQIPIYYEPLWGTDFQIIPDSSFVYGPDAINFDVNTFLATTPGWFKSYRAQVNEKNRSAAQMITYYAESYSINPKLMLALVEYQTGALSNPRRDLSVEDNFLGFTNNHTGPSLQISFVADLLNDVFYRYSNGELTSIEHQDGTLENIDPWQNAATAALQHYFSLLWDGEDYMRAIGPDGFARTYLQLFGNPWNGNTTVLPGNLEQPKFILPFQDGTTWAYTGGPHAAWGNGKPWAALDFAPPSMTQGCNDTEQFALAVADGVVVRTDAGTVMLDLDGDGDERTGWVILYLHIAAKGRVRVGTEVKQGDKIGHPSCEGGKSTGTHVHIARKYNGQWIPAASSILPFNMEGWIPVEGALAYQGTLVRGSDIVYASTLSGPASMISAD